MSKKEPVYEMLWCNKWITADTSTIEEFIAVYKELAEYFTKLKEAGITLDPDSGIGDDYASFITKDAEVAKKFGFEQPEWDEEFDEDCDDEDCEEE